MFLMTYAETLTYPFVFFNRTWHSRKILWTRDFFYFSRDGDYAPIDMIPLYEVIDVKAMSSLQTGAETAPAVMSDAGVWRRMDSLCKFVASEGGASLASTNHAQPILSQYDAMFQITTAPDGFNSGKNLTCRRRP